MSEASAALRVVWSGSAREGFADLTPEVARSVGTILDRLGRDSFLRSNPADVIRVSNGIGDGMYLVMTLHADIARGLLRVRDLEVVPPDGEESNWHASPAARSAAAFAARLAGPTRPHLRDEWETLLCGSAEEGVSRARVRQQLLALGFLVAAVRMRVRDFSRPAWRPVDWVLRAPSRINASITLVVGAQAVYVVGDGGLVALATDVWEPCGIAGASLFVLARWLRRVRGIELATSESERADE
jgi:hypothetical protein